MQNNPFLSAEDSQSARWNAAGIDGQDFRLAAVYSVNAENTEVTLLLDGTAEPTRKYYKALTGAWPLATDDRVIVLKMSGTYVVVGKIGGKPDDPEPPTYIAAPNTVFAGPATGTASAEATFRALTADDIPGGGGGDVETVVVTSGILTPASGVTISSQKLAYCGKHAALYFSYKPGSSLSHAYDSKTLATIVSKYRPAVSVNIVAESFNATSATGGRSDVLIKISDAGVVTHCGMANYNGAYECYVEYLLA